MRPHCQHSRRVREHLPGSEMPPRRHGVVSECECEHVLCEWSAKQDLEWEHCIQKYSDCGYDWGRIVNSRGSPTHSMKSFKSVRESDLGRLVVGPMRPIFSLILWWILVARWLIPTQLRITQICEYEVHDAHCSREMVSCQCCLRLIIIAIWRHLFRLCRSNPATFCKTLMTWSHFLERNFLVLSEGSLTENFFGHCPNGGVQPCLPVCASSSVNINHCSGTCVKLISFSNICRDFHQIIIQMFTIVVFKISLNTVKITVWALTK